MEMYFERNQIRNCYLTSRSSYDADLTFYDNTFENNSRGLSFIELMGLNITYNLFKGIEYTAISINIPSNVFSVTNCYFVDNNIGQISQVTCTSPLGGFSNNFWSDLRERIFYPIPGYPDKYDLSPRYDTDSDDLNDYYEIYVHFTDMEDSDTDDDLLLDGFEIINSLNPLIDDATEDPDADGLTNLEEQTYQTKAQEEDSDEDLMTDGYEIRNDLNPLFNDANLDKDGDGLTNYQEFIQGTKANNFDSDEDGMSDSWEVENGLNALLNDASEDPDNDSLNNYLEYIYGCEPFNNDTDGDSYSDGLEIFYSTNPTDPLDYPEVSEQTVESSNSLIFIIFAVLGLGFLFSRKRK